MVTTGESFRLRWNDFGNNFMGSVRQLREDDDFIDVSLVTSDSGNKVLEGHKVVLAACSNFFKEILRRQSRSSTHPSPYIFLRGISYEDLAAILEFMYYGEVRVSSEKLGSFLAAAEELQIKGLTNRKNAQIVSRKVGEATKVPRHHHSGGGPAKKIRRSLPQGSGMGHLAKSEEAKDVEDTSLAMEEMMTEEVVIKTDPDAALAEELDQQDELNEQDYDGGSAEENDFGEPKKSKFDPMQYVRRLEDSEGAKAECTICNSKFRGVLNAKVHAIRTHGPPEYYQCNFCGKVVRCSYNFRDHIMRAHGINGRKLVETYGKLVGEM